MTKTLNDRVLEAKAIASLGKVLQRHNQHVTGVLVPGSEGTQNHVLIRRHKGAIMSTECRKVIGGNGHAVCKGNLSGFCRHSLAAVMIAMRESGYKPRFRKDAVKAQKLATKSKAIVLEYEGEPVVFTLRSWQSPKAKPLYMVAIDETAEELQNV